ncbi:MAG: hypothetical protein PHQ12_09005 [Chthoniobacteraceae bacterium]|nr:hypothetical protein [Chthoniobacteraceae bacterium]
MKRLPPLLHPSLQPEKEVGLVGPLTAAALFAAVLLRWLGA